MAPIALALFAFGSSDPVQRLHLPPFSRLARGRRNVITNRFLSSSLSFTLDDSAPQAEIAPEADSIVSTNARGFPQGGEILETKPPSFLSSMSSLSSYSQTTTDNAEAIPARDILDARDTLDTDMSDVDRISESMDSSTSHQSEVEDLVAATVSLSESMIEGQRYLGTDSVVDVASPAKKDTNLVGSFMAWCAQQIESPTEVSGRIMALIAAAIYGTNFAAVKMLDDTIPSAIGASARFVVAAAVVTSLTLHVEASSARDTKKSDSDELSKPEEDTLLQEKRNSAFWGGAEIGIWYSVGYICQALSLESLDAGKSSFFNALAVVLVPLLDFAIRGKILRAKDLLSVLLALLGVATLEIGPGGDISFASGDFLALGQTVFFGIGYWRLEAQSQKYSDNDARLTAGQLCGVAIGSLLFTGAEYGPGLGIGMDFPTLQEFVGWFTDPFVIGVILWTALVSTALAIYLETIALKVISASELTLLMTTVSIWGAGFAYLTLGEVLSTTGLIGGALILAGCVCGNLSAPESLFVRKQDELLNSITTESVVYDDELSAAKVDMQPNYPPLEQVFDSEISQ